jgi:hypothetical protein
MAAGKYDFVIEQGGTFNPTIRYAQSTFTKKAITGVTKSGRATATVVGHGLTTNWGAYVVGVIGMDLINHKSRSLAIPEEAYEASVVDANTLELAVDSSRFGAYASGGELLYRTPFNFTGYTARMMIRDAVADVAPITGGSLTTGNGGIVLGGAAGTITLAIDAATTAAFDVRSYVYDLEIVSAGGVVTPILYGSVVVPRREVTR